MPMYGTDVYKENTELPSYIKDPILELFQRVLAHFMSHPEATDEDLNDILASLESYGAYRAILSLPDYESISYQTLDSLIEQIVYPDNPEKTEKLRSLLRNRYRISQ